MYVVKKEKSRENIRSVYVILRVTPGEKEWLVKKSGGEGNLSYMVRYHLGLENAPGVENYIPPEE